MAIKFAALMMVSMMAAASAASAQSANRTGTPPTSAPSRVETLAPEREAVTKCRRHCDSGYSRLSGAERQARQSHCAKRMVA